jgi:hypothetical protein
VARFLARGIAYNTAAMPETTAIHSLHQAAYCPRCGYDQRGRAVGDRCPECGEQSDVGVAIEQIHIWARNAITDLWCVAILQLIGMACGLAGLVAGGRLHPVAGLLGAAAGTYLCSALAWYAVIVAGFLRRRSGPNYRNLSVQQRRVVTRWLMVDLFALVAPAVFLTIPWFLRGL